MRKYFCILILFVIWEAIECFFPSIRINFIFAIRALVGLLITYWVINNYIKKYTFFLSLACYITFDIIPCYILENYLFQYNYERTIGCVVGKDRYSKGRHNKVYVLLVETHYWGVQELSLIYKDYAKVSIGDTIIVGKAFNDQFRIWDWKPSSSLINGHQTPQHYKGDDLQKSPIYDNNSFEFRDSILYFSHVQTGAVYEKLDDEYYRHLVKVGIDSQHTTTHEFVTTDRLYTKIYKRLNIGDKVLLQVSDSLPEINRVINWQPTEAELELYKQPQPFNEKMIVKDYSRCTKEFEKEKLHESHKRLGVIYDKYKDDYVGAYLEVGIDENHTRAHIFHTYDEGEMKVYNETAVGDTVILRVSDALPQLNSVLTWHPTHEEIEKYKTPVKLIEK